MAGELILKETEALWLPLDFPLAQMPHKWSNHCGRVHQPSTTKWIAKQKPYKYIGRDFTCKNISLTKKNHPLRSHYHIDNKQIKQVTTAKYLGVTIGKNLNWSEHTVELLTK